MSIARFLARSVAWAMLLLVLACAVNPVTGQREIVFMSESQEIAMGQQSAPQIEATMGHYDDEALQRYVEGIALPMARASERPRLPWQFRVVDDPAVNAFAVPGGFVYVTRGILAHMNSEAELASVLGHEIGHVTARHSVAQYTKQMGAQVALGTTAVLLDSPGTAQLLGAGMQVMLLKYGRDDEIQSDELGLRYMTRSGYRGSEMVDVFRTLDRIGERAGAGATPEWLSTHPKPGNRVQMIEARLAQLPDGGTQGRVGREEFLKRLDGVLYGNDPRQGYFDDAGVFHHPEMAFRLRFPPGWQTVNQRSVVGAISPEQDGTVQLALSGQSSADAAAQVFLSAQGLQGSLPKRRTIGGLPATTADFANSDPQNPIRGVAAFIEHGDHVYSLLGYAPAQRFPERERELREALASFARETNRSVLAVQPWRLDVVTPRKRLSIAGFASTYPGPVSAADLALINQIAPGGSYAAGVPVKRVVGKPLP